MARSNAYYGIAPNDVVDTEYRYAYIAASGQTSFNAIYTPGSIDVFVNGSKVFPSEFIAANGTTVVLNTAAVLDDEVQIITRKVIPVVGAVSPTDLVNALSFKADTSVVYSLSKPNWIIKSTSYTAVASDSLMCDTTSSAFTIVLPAAPAANDVVRIADYAGTFATNNLTIGRGALNIMGLAKDVVLNTNNASITLTYVDATQGFVITNYSTLGLSPQIISITGNLYSGAQSTLEITVMNTESSVDVLYLQDNVLKATASAVPVVAGVITTDIPASVYNLANLTTIDVVVKSGSRNSNVISLIATQLPSGGTVSLSNGYRIHTFNTSSNFVIPSGQTIDNIEYVIVGGGGGGGGNYYGGGGGAGGYRSSVIGEASGSNSSAESVITMPSGTYAVVVGAGGGGGVSTQGSSGGSSSIYGITALGGGYGAPNSTNAGSGGSGGGGAGGAGGAGTTGQGSAGSTGGPNSAGGGGGAAAVGQLGTSSSPQSGGAGLVSSITGAQIARAGGGGGSMDANHLYFVALGGSGGGGNAAADYAGPIVQAQSGAANTGGGGGGGCHNSTATGGAGGSGVVILRYPI